MLSVKLLFLLAACVHVRTAILEHADGADLEVVRIRLEEEKAKRLLIQNDVEVLMLQVEELKRKYDQSSKQAVHGNVTLVTHGIGFTATLSLTTKYVSEQTVIFDHVMVNEGNCYDSSTGRFKAPVKGLYSFSPTVLASSGVVHLCIMKNKDEIGRMYTGTETGSVTVITVMDQGQVVYVKECPGYSQTLYGNNWSTFTGLLHARYE